MREPRHGYTRGNSKIIVLRLWVPIIRSWALTRGVRAPSRDQESVRDSGHEDSASAPIAAGQRPRQSGLLVRVRRDD